MYFYTLLTPEGIDLYDNMIKMVPEKERLALNMMDTFQELAKQYSIDYWLNANVNDFNPVYTGIVTSSSNTTVDVRMALTQSDGQHEHKVIRVRTADLVDSSRSQVGDQVQFHIPYGVDMARDQLGIGGYDRGGGGGAHDVEHVVTPDNLYDALDIIRQQFSSTGQPQMYRTRQQFVLLGIIAILRLVVQKTPIHFAVESDMPSIVWSCVPMTNKRTLSGSTGMMKRWLTPTRGISLLILDLVGARCNASADTSTLTNILVYVPQWKTVERLNPRGYMPYEYDQVALDTKLHDLLFSLNPSIRYMSSTETQPLRGIERLLGVPHSDATSAAFALLYMHVRIVHIQSLLHDGVVDEAWPLHFQRKLVEAMHSYASSSPHGKGKFEEYIKAYSQHVLQTRQYVLKWDGYNYDMLFNDNCIALIHHLRTAKPEPPKTQELQGPLKYLFDIEGVI